MKNKTYYMISDRKGHTVSYIHPVRLDVCEFTGPFDTPADANEVFKSSVAQRSGSEWLTLGSFKSKVQDIADERQRLKEWNAFAFTGK